jgi:hypothetical protein
VSIRLRYSNLGRLIVEAGRALTCCCDGGKGCTHVIYCPITHHYICYDVTLSTLPCIAIPLTYFGYDPGPVLGWTAPMYMRLFGLCYVRSGCTLDLHISASVHGPWTPYRNVSINPCGGNNPAPYVHPNGTVYVVFTDYDMGLWRAPSWEGPFELVTIGACGGGEDPSLYLDKHGRFHCLFHASPFSNPDIAIGHAFSLDGYEWRVAAEPAANSTIEFAGGLGAVVHGKRERPHLTISINGGIADLEAVETHLQHVDGVMLGRAAYQEPGLLGAVDRRVFGSGEDVTAFEAVERYRP